MEASGAVDALQALASLVIAISHGVQVDVVVAVARAASLSLLGIAEIAVRASLASRPGSAHRALGANWIGIVAQQDARAIVRARAGLTVVCRSLERLPVVTTAAELAVAARRVVLTDALASLGLANVGVTVAVARHA